MGQTELSKKMSERKQVRSALERIEALEQTLPQLLSGINSAFQQVDGRLGELEQKIDALIELTGPAEVQATIDATLARRNAERAAAMTAAVEAALKNGTLVKADVVGENSLVVGTEFDKDNQPLNGGRSQLNFPQIKPEFKVQIQGKPVGSEFSLPTGGKFVVTEIYTPVEKPPEAPAAVAPEAKAVVQDDHCSSCPNAGECQGTSDKA